MSASRSRASDLAAQQVEQIVAAAQDAADQIRDEAESERAEMRDQARRDAERAREQALAEVETTRRKAHDQSEAELNEARKQAVALGQDSRREAEETLDLARKEARQLRDETKSAVEGRVAAAEKAAAQVLSEAEALSGGLRQLGRSLEGQADRILRDVQAAHKRMQADLRVESGDELPRTSSARAPRDGASERPPGRSRPRDNPFDEIDVPDWSKPTSR